ncbi:MAG: homocitrate synthase [Herpetosiphonaceae bacterium]|nr:homocitrate synthase [Herpetosiphonaceae bacterium]
MTLDRFSIIDSTLREGEQFARARFTTAQKVAIAEALDAFGVEYIEATSPVASPQSEHDLRTLTALPLHARILTHTRCTIEDARRAVDCHVGGVNLLFGASQLLREHSHGRTVDQIIAEAITVIRFLQACDVEVRFSCEDAFRTERADLLQIFRAVDACGVQRVGIADTVGIATPREVEALVRDVRANVRCDIEFHGHNDGGCAIANAFAALETGATHLDTTVLGIGERNGITSLSGLIARLYLSAPQLVTHYRLQQLPALDRMVAEFLGIDIPFNSCITGETAFTHKAGLHTNAVLKQPTTYEALDPAIFGRERSVLIGHRLTGRHAVAQRARELGIELGGDALQSITHEIKTRADNVPLSALEVDSLLLAQNADLRRQLSDIRANA